MPKPVGTPQNLYEVDFTGAIALAMEEGARMFFGAVFDGVIPELAYQGEGSTIIIGHIESEDDQVIRFDQALAVTPLQMRNVHQATNYSPVDCCRGMLNDLRELQPQLLGPLTVLKGTILERLELANT